MTALARPRYRPDVAALDALLARLGPHLPPLSLDDEAIAARAEAAEGWSDWGEPGARQGLALLSADLRAHPPSGVGRLMASQVLLNAARLRLRLLRLRAEGALPDRGPTRPWVISGLHRSGTTWMQRLLEAVPGRGGVPNHRLIHPLPQRGSLLRTRILLGFSRWVAPEMWALHPPHPVTPDECWTLCTPSFRIYDLALHWRLPRTIAWLDHTPMEPAADTYRLLLGALERELGLGPRAMKSPCHIAALGPMLRALPDATFIWVHRDPVHTVPSFCRLSAIQRRTLYGEVDPRACGEATLSRAAAAVRRGMEGLDVAPGRLVHVAYDELVRDPVGVVERVAERAGEPLDAAGREAVARLARAKGGGRMGEGRVRPEDWGLDAAGIRAAMPEYMARFIDRP